MSILFWLFLVSKSNGLFFYLFSSPGRKFYENNELRQFARQQEVQFEQYCNQLISMKSPIARHPFLLLFFQPKFEDIEPSQSIL
jgi:hypothetical protein